METGGYIKLHRSIQGWGWKTDVKVYRVWIEIMLSAYWKDSYYKGELVKRGSFPYSLTRLSEETGLSIQEVRTCLAKLERTGEITKKSTRKINLITVEKYDDFQLEDVESNTIATVEQHDSNTLSTSNEEYKESKNNIINNNYKEKEIHKEKEVKRFEKPTLDQLRAYIDLKDLNVDPQAFIDHYESNGWKVGRNSMKDWKSALRNWHRMRQERGG